MHVANALPLVAEMPPVGAASRHSDDTGGGFAQVLQRARKTGQTAAGSRPDTPDPRTRGAGSPHPSAPGQHAEPGSATGKAGTDEGNTERGVTGLDLPDGPADDTGGADRASPSAPNADTAPAWPIQTSWQPPDAAADDLAPWAEVTPVRRLAEPGAATARGRIAKHRGDEPQDERGPTASARSGATQAGRTASRSATEDAAADAADRISDNVANHAAKGTAAAVAKQDRGPEQQVHLHGPAPEAAASAPAVGAASESPSPVRTPSHSSPSSPPNGVGVGVGASVSAAAGEQYPDNATAAAPARLLPPGGSAASAVRSAGEVEATDERFDAPGPLTAKVAREGKPADAPAGAALPRGLEPVLRPAHTEGPLAAGASGVGLAPPHADTTAITATLATLTATALRPGVVDTAVAGGPAREIHAPLHSPGFAPALGAQLSLMVRDGVAEAMLHLHPAEMGPIAVQIQIEGQHARVEMVAEQAVTRQVLEQSMPSLASALRDSGLTLTGGGVFEQSTRQGQPGDTPNRQSGARAGDTASAEGNASADLSAGALAAGRLARPRGVVDLYA